MSNAIIALMDELELEAARLYRQTYGKPEDDSLELLYVSRGVAAMRAAVAIRLDDEGAITA